MGCGQKSFMKVWRGHQLISGFLQLPRVSRQSRLSVNVKVKQGAVRIFPDICHTVEENPGKLQLGDHLMKAVQPVISSNGVPYFKMRSVRSHSTSGREKEGRDFLL